MPPFLDTDQKTKVSAPAGQESGTVILVNEFIVEPEDTEQFLQLWAEHAAIMKRQPGFVSAQMHQGVGDNRRFLNYAVWDSASDFQRAVNHPEFQAKTREFPQRIVASPHLFQKVAVPGICAD